MKRKLLWALALGLVCVVAFVVNLIWFRPLFIDHFYAREFVRYALIDPELMTTLGMVDGTPLDFHSHRLTDASLAQQERMLKITTEALGTLEQYDRSSLDADARLSYDIFEWFLEIRKAGEAFVLHPYAILQNRGAYLNLVDFMSREHRVTSLDGAEAYLSRLSAVAGKLDQQLAVARQQEAGGVVPPRFIIRKTLMNLHNIRDVDAAASLYFRPFAEKVDALDLSTEEAEALKVRALSTVQDVVYPAYDRTIEFLGALQARATDDAGVWKLPDGDAYYQYCIRLHTSTNLTAEEIHQLGLSEVARIETEMNRIFVGLGYGQAPPAELLRRVSEDPRFLMPGTDESREALVKGYQQIIDQIDARIGRAFNRRPRAALEVRRIPTYRQQTAASHCSMPAMDGSRPGVFFVNLTTVPPVWTMRTLPYHEGIPGHHFQIALQMEQEGVPLFRKVVPFTAFSEGWALYAERLAWELGFQADPYDNLGRLEAELFRAVRLVVDTGIHHKRWTREQALAYFRTHMGSENVSEVERYVVWPGQALAYKVGMMEILKQRERAREALGDAFDLRDFHDVVIGSGAMPLEVLARQVERYIAKGG